MIDITTPEVLECIESIEIAYSDAMFPLHLTEHDERDQPDYEDVRYFKDAQRSYAIDKELFLMHGTYALRYFQLPAVLYFLPKLMLAFIQDKFRYQPIADSIVLGLLDQDWNLGRHVAHMTKLQKDAIVAWLDLVRKLDIYDAHELLKARQLLV